MKKKNLKSLKLNKKVISNLEQDKIKGGSDLACVIIVLHSYMACPSDECPPSGKYSCECTVA